MTQVWMVRNSDTDIHLFNRYEHLLPSVQISYHRCKDIKIEVTREATEVTFRVTGYRIDADGPKDIDQTIVAKCYSVWTEPSHL